MNAVARSRPIVQQIDLLLRQRIQARVYRPGSRLPSETDLAQELGVSRASLRSALARLAADGLIARRQGDGTYVTPHLEAATATVSGLLDFWRLVEAYGRRPAIRVLRIEHRPAQPHERAALALPEEADVVGLRRLYTADERPFIVADNVLPAAGLIRQPTTELAQLPIDALLTTCWGQTLDYAVYDIRPGSADKGMAGLLDCPVGAPLLHLAATIYAAGDRPMIHGQSWYNDAVISLRFVQTWR